jgi:hypothetical protein
VLSCPQHAAVASGKQALGGEYLSAAKRLELLQEALEGLATTHGAPRATKDVIGEVRNLLDIVRRTRNEHGHPSGIPAMRQTALMQLTVFPAICKHVYDIIGWLNTLDGDANTA